MTSKKSSVTKKTPIKKKTVANEVMVVNDAPGEECRIAILEDNHLEELYSERQSNATKVGNIYKGRVANVEPAIQAAFIDYGEGANGFLHISDLHPRYFPGGDRVERVGRKIPRRERPPMQEALRRGDEVMVQVLKEGIGTKGPTLTSYLAIPGRLLVAMPDMDRVGVSRKVEDEEGRREMRKVLDALELPDGFGFILRTAGIGKTKTDLKRDVAYLMRLWKVMDKRIQNVGAPCELYTESDLLIRTVRDVLRPTIKAIVVDSESAYDRVSTFLQVVAPRSAPAVVRYARTAPIFHAFDIERQIDLIHSREVPLPSGGALVIDQTEALVAIDVNSGKSRGARDSETNAFRTNCEAVDEICRQLRLRDLGGLIIHDLIDMRAHRHRREIEERFQNNLKRDRARSTILKISDFGLVEMTRQRMRPSMRKSHFVSCPACEGHGEIKSSESIAADVTRHLGFLLDHDRVRRVEINCSPRVASVLLSRKRRELVRLEDSSGKTIDVRVSDVIASDKVDYYAYDDRNADINLEHLPRPSLPTLTELEKEESLAPAEFGGDSDERKPRRRSRRRRKAGPADATAIALAGGFEEGEEHAEAITKDEPTEAAPAKKRSRRRRRSRKDEEETPDVATSKATPPEPAPEPEPLPSMRVHQLAKHLGVKSSEVLEKCQGDEYAKVKGHMSSLTSEQATALSVIFQPEPEPAPEIVELEAAGPDEGEDTPKPARKRRRRRGGRRRRGASDESGEGVDADASDERAGQDEPATVADDETEPRAEDNGDGKKKKRRGRRGRRGGRRNRPSGDGEETNNEDGPTRDEAAAPAVTVTVGADASPTEGAPAGAPDGASDGAATKKRRSLYASRRPVVPAVLSDALDDR